MLMSARGGSGELLLVEGHAGIGKTALLEAAVTRAREDGVTVLRARAAALESEFQFGIALRLFEPLLAGADDETRDRLLAGSAALAGPLLERPTSWAGTAGDDRFYPVTHGLFRLLANLTESGPVLIAIDDVHWADRASLRLVLYLLGRLDEMAVSFIVTRRLGEPGAPDDLLAQIATHAASRAVRPPPLSRHGARRMVAAALPGADEAFGDACWRMTEGNVFLLQELIAAVRDEGWEPDAQNATRIGTLAPEAVLRAVSVRLMRLSDDAAGIARAVAVLGEEAQLRHVVALTGGDARPRRGGRRRAGGLGHPAPARHRRADVRPPAARLGGLRRHRDRGARGAASPRGRDPARRARRARARRRASAADPGQRGGLGRRCAARRGAPRADDAGRRSRRRATCGARSTSRPRRRRARRAAARARARARR